MTREIVRGNLPQKSQRAIRKVVWSVDAFEALTELQKCAAQVIRYLGRTLKTEVEPVYVLSPAQLNLSIEFTAPWIQQYRPAAEQALDRLFRESGVINFPNLKRPQVIVQNFSSTAHAVEALTKYAVAEGADAILVSTHARRGVSRFLLGSFAETLLLKSPVPVISVGPQIRKVTDFKRILFPTEFGRYSKAMFKRVVALAKEFDAELTIFHAIPHPIEPVFQSGVYLLGGSWVPVQAYFTSELDQQNRRAEAWAGWARRQGVVTDILIDTCGANVVDTLLSIIKKKKIGLVAMESQSGPIASVLLGSVTRQAVRAAECPVWVIRSQTLARRMPVETAKPPARRAA